MDLSDEIIDKLVKLILPDMKEKIIRGIGECISEHAKDISEALENDITHNHSS